MLKLREHSAEGFSGNSEDALSDGLKMLKNIVKAGPEIGLPTDNQQVAHVFITQDQDFSSFRFTVDEEQFIEESSKEQNCKVIYIINVLVNNKRPTSP